MDCLARLAAAVDLIFLVKRAPRPLAPQNFLDLPPGAILWHCADVAEAQRALIADGRCPVARALSSQRASLCAAMDSTPMKDAWSA